MFSSIIRVHVGRAYCRRVHVVAACYIGIRSLSVEPIVVVSCPCCFFRAACHIGIRSLSVEPVVGRRVHVVSSALLVILAFALCRSSPSSVVVSMLFLPRCLSYCQSLSVGRAHRRRVVSMLFLPRCLSYWHSLSVGRARRRSSCPCSFFRAACHIGFRSLSVEPILTVLCPRCLISVGLIHRCVHISSPWWQASCPVS